MTILESPFFRSVAAITRAMEKALTYMLGLCVLVMVLLVFGNVVLRYGFNSGITISEEVARMSFVWLIFLGTVIAFRTKQHLGVNMLLDRLPIMSQKIIHILRQLIIMWVLWLLMQGGWDQMVIGVNTALPVTGWSQALFSGMVWFSAVAMFVLAIGDIAIAIMTPAERSYQYRFRTAVDHVDDAE